MIAAHRLALPIALLCSAHTACILDVAVGEKLCDAAHACVAGEQCVRGRCLAGEGEGEGEGDAAAVALRIDTLETTDCATASHAASGNGDDRGGIAWSPPYLLYTGDDQTLRADLAALSQQSLLPERYDAMFSDLDDGTLWQLTDLDDSFFSSGDFEAEQLTELDAETGEPTGLAIPLEFFIEGLNDGVVGVFAGRGKVALDIRGVVHVIDLHTGAVRFAPHRAPLDDATPCETWAVWGVLETFGGQDHIVYAANGGRFIRVNLTDGARETVATLDDAGDICGFTLDPIEKRWLFHQEVDTEFVGDIDEVLVSCPASLCVDDDCTCSGAAVACADDVDVAARGCADTATDPDNCATCGHACPGARNACVDGTCACAGRFPDSCSAGDCTDLATDEDNCTACDTPCDPLTHQCLSACVATHDLHVDDLTTDNCQTLDVDGVAGDESRALVGAGGALLVYSGNAATTTVPQGAVGGGALTNIGASLAALATDYLTGTVYAFTRDGDPVGDDFTSVDGIAPVNVNDASIGAITALQTPIDIDGGVLAFSGAGRLAVRTSKLLAVIDVDSGFVDEEPLPPAMDPSFCNNGWGNGVLEKQGGEDTLVFVSGGAVVRETLAGARETLFGDEDLADSCAVAVGEGRWFVAAPRFSSFFDDDGRHRLIACDADVACADCAP